jgi:ribosome maturation factor RimP
VESSELVERLWRAVEPDLLEQGYELVELELTRQGRTPLLRIFIDKPGGGISLEDCTAASQLLNPLLDGVEALDEHYLLEVSSPGIARPIRKQEDFARFAGEEVKLTTHAPTDGRKKFTGILRGIQDGLIQLDCEGKTYAIHAQNLKKAHLNR